MYIIGTTPVQQGEVRICRIDAIPTAETRPVARGPKGYVISHSESGHHHILTDGEVMELSDAPLGMQVFYAILREPAAFIQDAANPHGGYSLPAGIYEMRISREFDPFAEQARRVAD